MLPPQDKGYHVPYTPIRIVHAGDWVGQQVHLVDIDTDELLDAYLSVAVLPYSGYTVTIIQ